MCNMVEGVMSPRRNRLQHPLKVVDDVHRRDVQHPIIIQRQKRVAGFVPGRPITAIMRFAVDFDDEAPRAHVEIHDIRTNWMLSAHFYAEA